MNKFLKNTFFVGFESVSLIFLNLMATPLLINGFGIDIYGIYIFLNLFSVFGALMLFDFGLEGALMTFISKHDANKETEKINEAFSVALIIYMFISTCISVIFWAMGDIIISSFLEESITISSEELYLTIKIITLNIFIQFLSLPFIAFLQGLRKYQITKSINIFLTFIQYTAVIYIALSYHNLSYVFFAILGVSIIRLLILIYFVIFRSDIGLKVKLVYNQNVLKKLVNFSSILFVSRLIGLIFNHMDRFLIWRFLEISSLAIYDVVSRPANLLRMLISIINSTLIPEVSRIQNDPNKIKELFSSVVRLTYIILIPILTFLFIYIDKLLSLWVGDDFVQYSHYSMILLIVYGFSPIPSTASTIAVGMQMVKKTIWISIVAALINLIVSFVLLFEFGLLGLFLATFVAQFFMVFPYYLFMSNKLDLDFMTFFKPIFKTTLVNIPFILIQYYILIAVVGSFYFLFSVVFLIMALQYVSSYYFLLNNYEQNTIMNIIAKIRGKDKQRGQLDI